MDRFWNYIAGEQTIFLSKFIELKLLVSFSNLGFKFLYSVSTLRFQVGCLS